MRKSNLKHPARIAREIWRAKKAAAYDWPKIKVALQEYIEQTEIPIMTEFASRNKVTADAIYTRPELGELVVLARDKKQAALESKALSGDVNVAMAIFSLKQMGWSDKVDNRHSGDSSNPIIISKAAALW